MCTPGNGWSKYIKETSHELCVNHRDLRRLLVCSCSDTFRGLQASYEFIADVVGPVLDASFHATDCPLGCFPLINCDI